MNTTLSKQELKWIIDQRVTRISDNEEALIYPMGAERFLSLVLSGDKPERYNIKEDIQGKRVLVIPGYGNSAFLFAEAGAKSVTVYDKDPVTIAWIKAFKNYYHYRTSQLSPSIGELLAALTQWYPPLLKLPTGRIKNSLCWAINPKALRRTYIFYILSLVQEAIQSQAKGNFELENDIEFHTGELSHLIKSKEEQTFDTVFVPYLLGVRNGIESEQSIVEFIKNLIKIVPNGSILVTPSQNVKEFHFFGQSYFETTDRANIQSIPGLKPYLITEDNEWFKPQGLVVFGAKNK